MPVNDDPRKSKGLVQVTGWVHPHQAADIKLAIAMLKERPSLEIAVLRDTITGRFVSFVKQWCFW